MSGLIKIGRYRRSMLSKACRRNGSGTWFHSMQPAPQRQVASHVVDRGVPLQWLTRDRQRDGGRSSIEEGVGRVGAGTTGLTVVRARCSQRDAGG
jgi:hypothetical protein